MSTGSLKSLKLEPFYSTDEYEDIQTNKILNELMIPCLRNSIEYDRVSAFYASKVLVYIFQGLKELIKNNGKIKLVIGCLPQKEFEVANNEERKFFYEEDFIETLLNQNEWNDKEFKTKFIQLFAWLIDQNLLEIKLGFILNEKGDYANKEEIDIALRDGMLHNKIGLFRDKEGFIVGFHGSLNETFQAFFSHSENVEVQKSWDILTGEKENIHLKGYINP